MGIGTGRNGNVKSHSRTSVTYIYTVLGSISNTSIWNTYLKYIFCILYFVFEIHFYVFVFCFSNKKYKIHRHQLSGCSVPEDREWFLVRRIIREAIIAFTSKQYWLNVLNISFHSVWRHGVWKKYWPLCHFVFCKYFVKYKIHKYLNVFYPALYILCRCADTAQCLQSIRWAAYTRQTFTPRRLHSSAD